MFAQAFCLRLHVKSDNPVTYFFRENIIGCLLTDVYKLTPYCGMSFPSLFLSLLSNDIQEREDRKKGRSSRESEPEIDSDLILIAVLSFNPKTLKHD